MTTNYEFTPVGNSLRICLCCGVNTTVTCRGGACLNCHSQGLCHDK